MKYVHSTELQKRALDAGLRRSLAVVLAVLGYWAQVPGGVKKGKGLPWKWRNYQEIGAVSGYSSVTIQRAVRQLKSEQLLETRLMFNPAKPGQTVNGFRLTGSGYALLGLPIPIGASAHPGQIEGTDAGQASLPVGNDQDDDSQQQETFKKNQEEDDSCSGEENKGKKGLGEKPDLSPDDVPATLEEVAAMLGKKLV